MDELERLRRDAADCRACPLWQTGTQTVFGEGAASAQVVFVGEQPGDQEDKQGRPFVGPAGRVLDEALELAGIDRSTTYVTNAVKHFKWTARGKRRIHAKPSWSEVAACHPWLQSELEAIEPTVVVCRARHRDDPPEPHPSPANGRRKAHGDGGVRARPEGGRERALRTTRACLKAGADRPMRARLPRAPAQTST